MDSVFLQGFSGSPASATSTPEAWASFGRHVPPDRTDEIRSLTLIDPSVVQWLGNLMSAPVASMTREIK
ncbi:hypothetical protein N7495_006218 [Penicillium taxi]|uniref:uncharacterized protein n=1 Tax=Penicillium taxi TaxID=168475 RepID=UPI002544EC00|nr:uncharacterized protein N7495_006218 [Penicillium taxi]KAJ5894527.1 hypothetical protein N7495_006218 [Penicillium taxi]